MLYWDPAQLVLEQHSTYVFILNITTGVSPSFNYYYLTFILHIGNLAENNEMISSSCSSYAFNSTTNNNIYLKYYIDTNVSDSDWLLRIVNIPSGTSAYNITGYYYKLSSEAVL